MYLRRLFSNTLQPHTPFSEGIAFFLGKERHTTIELASLETNTKKKRWQAMSQRHSSEKPNNKANLRYSGLSE